MPNRKFHLFHLSLIPTSGPLFQGQDINREDYLRSVLEKNFEFSIDWGETHSRAGWVYKGQIDGAILGILQKEVPHQHHLPPEEGGEEVISPEWQGAFVVIDPTHHEKGQRASVEVDVVGKPSALLKALFGHLNENSDKSYEVIPEQILNEKDFWNYAERANNKLISVQFDFVVPNMFGAEEKIDKELKEVGLEGVQKVTILYKSKEGINALSEQVKGAVKYIKRGAGKIKASAFGLHPFDSTDSPSITEMPRFNTDESQDVEEFTKHKSEVLGYDVENSDNSDSDDTA